MKRGFILTKAEMSWENPPRTRDAGPSGRFVLWMVLCVQLLWKGLLIVLPFLPSSICGLFRETH